MRERIVAAVAAGGTHPAVARRFGVAVATVGNSRRLQRTTGGLPPRPRPGGRAASGPACYPARQGPLRTAPDAPLAQPRVTWAETQGRLVSIGTIGRTLTRLGWTWKKTRLAKLACRWEGAGGKWCVGRQEMVMARRAARSTASRS